MGSSVLLVLFFVMHVAPASEEGIQILQNPAQLWLRSGETAQLDCSPSKKQWTMTWYREQGGNLQWIYLSSRQEPSAGKYSAKVNIETNNFSLIISNVQRNDSGVYYCGLSDSVYRQLDFGNGTRLIVTGEFPMAENNNKLMLDSAVKKWSFFASFVKLFCHFLHTGYYSLSQAGQHE
uniref:Ig-like domain-containing protein n=1 Tax=Pelusios castaneus TaxID=367368 RepID=A0A8C8SK02_9SAUR